MDYIDLIAQEQEKLRSAEFEAALRASFAEDPPSPEPPIQPPIDPPPGSAGIVKMVLPTDGTDVASEANAQIAAVPDGYTLVVPAGYHPCNFPLVMEDKTGVLLVGAIDPGTMEPEDRHGSVFIATKTGPELGLVKGGRSVTTRYHFGAKHCDDCEVTGIRIESTNITSTRKKSFATYNSILEFEHSFVVDGCHRFKLADVSSYGVWGDGLAIKGSGRDRYTEDFMSHTVWLDWVGRQGISVKGALRSKLYGYQMSAIRRSGVDLEPSGHGIDRNVDGFEMYDSVIHCQNGLISSAGGALVDNVHFHDMQQVASDPDNGIYRGSGRRVFVKAGTTPEGDQTTRRNWLLERIIFPDNGGAWTFINVDDVTIRDCVSPTKKSVLYPALHPEGKGKWGAPVRFFSCGGHLEVSGCNFVRIPGSGTWLDGDEIWQINSAPVQAFNNTPEMKILTESPKEA